jgi:murein L,D-transpeptidase YcbB/YkuD
MANIIRVSLRLPRLRPIRLRFGQASADNNEDVTSQRIKRTGLVPVRRFSKVIGAVAVLAAASVASVPAAAADTLGFTAVSVALAPVPQGMGVDDFYKLRQDRPLWFQNGQPTAAVQALIALLASSRTDGLDPATYQVQELQKAVQRASRKGDRHAVLTADKLLSEEFVAYARDLRAPDDSGLKYIDPALRVGAPTPLRLLEEAETAPSLPNYVYNMAWMNPDYSALRRALVSGDYDQKQRDLIKINLDRARVLPADVPRYLVVNTATQRLYMYDGGKLTDSMKVVVGQERPDRKTPPMAGYLHFAFLNPYWNVPPDLAWDDVGQYVQKYGDGYLKSKGYQILSDWSDDPTVVDPSSVDWDAVKDGSVKIRIRQLPGPENFLGDVKYTFTNPFGVYLHDTPRKELLDKSIRLFSGGCIRLENADRLGKWLFGHQLTTTSTDPDVKFVLDQPVPVYVVYLTAIPDGSSITFLDDVYGWDQQRLAQMDPSQSTLAGR